MPLCRRSGCADYSLSPETSSVQSRSLHTVKLHISQKMTSMCATRIGLVNTYEVRQEVYAMARNQSLEGGKYTGKNNILLYRYIQSPESPIDLWKIHLFAAGPWNLPAAHIRSRVLSLSLTVASWLDIWASCSSGSRSGGSCVWPGCLFACLIPPTAKIRSDSASEFNESCDASRMISGRGHKTLCHACTHFHAPTAATVSRPVDRGMNCTFELKI